MSGTVNKVIIVGYLGRDPEAKSFQNGGEIAVLRIATSESWKDRETGDRKERTEWHGVVIQSDGLVKVAKRYLRKGSKVYIEGQNRTRKWTDAQGVDRYVTEIVVTGFHGTLVLLDRAEGDGGRNDHSSYAGDDTGGAARAAKPNPFDSDLDDDVPF
jgi:single-strand DNA-binding protein